MTGRPASVTACAVRTIPPLETRTVADVIRSFPIHEMRTDGRVCYKYARKLRSRRSLRYNRMRRHRHQRSKLL
jgi:hypothetical protein